MADGSKIEWTDATWNPVTGCSVVSPGCTNCYAMRLAGSRMRHHPSRQGLTTPGKAGPVWNGVVRFNEQWLDEPLRWRRPRRVFVCAHGDLFHEAVPDVVIDRVFAVMALAPQHQFQVLTKRAQRMHDYLSAARAHPVGLEALGLAIKAQHANPRTRVGKGVVLQGDIAHLQVWPLPNVWLGVSVEDQARADERIPLLLDTPAAVRWLSMEPLLGPVDLGCIVAPPSVVYQPLKGVRFEPLDASGGEEETATAKVDWVVAGGESGPGARPMHPDWARSLRDQCTADGVPFLFKQWGAWWPLDQASLEWGMSVENCRDYFLTATTETHALIGKAKAGRLLDGVLHDGFPA